jgi:hypothetical protein
MDLDRLTALGQNNSNLLKLKSVDSSLEIRWRNSTCAVEALPSQILVSNVGTHIRQDFLHTRWWKYFTDRAQQMRYQANRCDIWSYHHVANAASWCVLITDAPGESRMLIDKESWSQNLVELKICSPEDS